MPNARSRRTSSRRRLCLAGAVAVWFAVVLPAACPAAIGVGASPATLIDTTLPIVSVTPLPANLLLHGGQSYTFHWTTGDAHPGLAAADYTAEIRDGQTLVESRSYLSTREATDWVWTAPEMSSGYLRLVVTCRDVRGNTTTVSSDQFSVILSTSEAPGTRLPVRPVLDGPRPNPCNPGATVRFRLPADGDVDLELWAADGTLVRRLAAGRFTAGEHEAFWDGRDQAGRAVASGTYFLRLLAGGTSQVSKLSLIR